MPIDADKEFTGTLFTLLNPFGLLGGLVTLLLFLTHGAMFLALKTDGEIRYRARALAVRLGVAAAVAAVVFLVWAQALTRRRRRPRSPSSSPPSPWSAALVAAWMGPRGVGLRRHLRDHRARGGAGCSSRCSPT